jgi:DNA (cytosine-5)-methyltransferase 1
MKVLDLFSGIGGFSLGLERAGMTTVAFCERDPFCRSVLQKHWPDVPIHNDIRNLDGHTYRGSVELVCGGFPCQPFSVAGKQKGKADDRHLWPEMFRVIAQSRPCWVVGENVPGIIGLGLDEVLSDLESEGYACSTYIIPACAVDAPHRRDRVWVVAHTDQGGESVGSVDERPRGVADSQDDPHTNGERPHRAQKHEFGESQSADRKERDPRPVCEVLADPKDSGKRDPRDVADASGARSQRGEDKRSDGAFWEEPDHKQPDRFGGGTVWLCDPARAAIWEPEPGVGRMAAGIPHRVDRLRALGNAVVPQVVEEIGRLILAYEVPK